MFVHRLRGVLPAFLLLPLLALGAPRGDATARLEPVADGVWAILHDNATEEWPHGNTGVIIGDDGVLVVDSTYLPSRARADISLIRQLTDKPVRYLVYTHWHFDHNNGGIAYKEAFPWLSVVSQRDTARWIELNGLWWSRMQTAAGSPHHLSLEKLQAQLTSGKDEKEAPLGAEARRALEQNIAQRKGEADELASLQVVTPDRLFDRELNLSLGKRKVQLRNRGKGNSPDDVTVYLPDLQVLFTGDLLVQAPLPYTGASWPLSWIGVLRELETVPVRALVPGHGPVMHDHAYTRAIRGLMEAATQRVEAKVRQGRTWTRSSRR
jgi:cyclase